MTKTANKEKVALNSQKTIIGIEGGATRTVAIYYDGYKTEQTELSQGNVRLLNDSELEALYEQIYLKFRNATIVVAGMAGARNKRDFQRIQNALKKFWKDSVCIPTNDLETALNSVERTDDRVRILVIAGTGSCVYGRAADGKTVKVNGWGHLLGDSGSAYRIGLNAIQNSLSFYDANGKFPALGSRLLRKLMLNEPDDFIEWAQNATKSEIAALAPEVFEAARNGDKLAKTTIAAVLENLVRSTICCAKRLLKNGQKPHFILAGGLFKNQQSFARDFSTKIKSIFPDSKFTILKESGAIGAVRIGIDYLKSEKGELLSDPREIKSVEVNKSGKDWKNLIPVSIKLSPTEELNPAAGRLDKIAVKKAVELFIREDSKISGAIMPHSKKIARAVAMVSSAFKSGGRLIYVGAGTSGRLGVLDASECPPTFGVPAEQVQAIVAGGARAVWQSVEGAEDDYEAGARAVEFRNVNRKDVVLGIAASGKTPFVWGALNSAKALGAKTILLCFNPYLKIPAQSKPSLVIAVETGAEMLTGSTRLKAGTATKMILNIISTLSMARAGRVKGNLMTDMQPSNSKLKERALRIVCQITGVSADKAKQLLEKTGWKIRSAINIARLEQH